MVAAPVAMAPVAQAVAATARLYRAAATVSVLHAVWATAAAASDRPVRRAAVTALRQEVWATATLPVVAAVPGEDKTKRLIKIMI